MSTKLAPEFAPVAAVCGNQVRIYGEKDKKTGIRPLKNTMNFPHYGVARLYADEFDEMQKPRA